MSQSVGKKIATSHAVGLILFHALAFYAIFFTRPSGIDLTLAAVLYFLRIFGITAGYHRYFTHRSFTTSRSFEVILAFLGALAGEGPLKRWVANHWQHHLHSDQKLDPHSPHENSFWHAHLGWLLDPAQFDSAEELSKRYHFSKGVEWVNRNTNLIFFSPVLMILIAAPIFHWVSPFTTIAWTMGTSTVLGLHATFAVNSVCHRLGYKSHQTSDDSRNNFLVALFTLGEGWHNNHHAHPQQVNHGEKAHELDLTYLTLLVLRFFRLVKFPAKLQILRPWVTQPSLKEIKINRS